MDSVLPLALTGSRRTQREVTSPGARGAALSRPLTDQDERAFRTAEDLALVHACRSGRREAFDELVVRHQQAIYRLCFRFVGNHEDASDLTQDVFVRAYRGLAGFKADAAFSTWLYRIGVNVCLNRLSTNTPASVELEPERHIDEVSAPPDAETARGERAQIVRRAIAALPRKQRATLILRVYHDLSHEQIARALGNSVGTVKANVFHALRNLRRLLDDGGWR